MRRLLLLVGAVLVLAAPAAGAQTYGGADALTIDASSVEAGGTVTAGGAGFAANSSVALSLESTPVDLGRVTTDGAGRFTRQVTLPSRIVAGTHTLIAAGTAPDGSSRVLTVTFTVTAAAGGGGATATTSAPLSTTGSSNTGTLAGLAVALVVLGGLVLVAVKRGRSGTDTA